MIPLEQIYQNVPGVPCIAGCTGCCVSPTMTLVEFIHLMNQVYAEHTGEELIQIINQPMKIHPWFSGNYYCRFQQKNGFCGVHKNRALACRLHGLPVIEKFDIDNLENCTIMDKSFLPNIEKSQTAGWLNQLMIENEKLHPDYRDSFYGLIALNVECWLDITYQKDAANEMFLEFQSLVRSRLSWQVENLEYFPHTDLLEKMEAIALLNMFFDTADAQSTYKLLQKIQNDYPRSGSYFIQEAKWMQAQVKAKLDAETSS